jgi:hypothetical protein
MSGEFEIEDWLVNNAFCEDTVEKLHRATVRDLDSLCLLSQYKVTALKLDIGDRGKFRRAIKRLREQYPDEDLEFNDDVNTGVDDSFDDRDPEQVATQQRMQFMELKNLQASQEKLSLQQFQLGQQGQQQPLLKVPTATEHSNTVTHSTDLSSVDQLSALLTNLNWTLVPSLGLSTGVGAPLQQ